MRKIWIIVGFIVIVAGIFVGIRLIQKPAPQEQVIKIGAILPLTGPAAEFGKSNLESSQLLVNLFNKSSKRKIKLIVEDSKSSPKDAINAYRKLIMSYEDLLFISSELSSVSMTIAPLTAKEGRLLMTIAATPLLNEYKYILRLYPTAENEAIAFSKAVKQFVTNPNEAIVIFYINDEFGNSVSKLTLEYLRKMGFKNVYSESFNITSSFDQKNIVAKYKYSKLGIVIGYGQSFGLIIKEFRNINKDAIIITSPEINFKDVLNLINLPDKKLYYLDILEPSKEINNLYRKTLHRSPNLVDLLVFDGFNILFKVINEIVEKNIELNIDEIYNRIIGRNFNFYGRTISVDTKGNVNYKMQLKTLNITRSD